MNAHIKFGELLSNGSQDIERKQNFGVNKGPSLLYICAEMTCNKSKLDLANMNAYIKFGEILSICSQDIERKRIFCVNKGP